MRATKKGMGAQTLAYCSWDSTQKNAMPHTLDSDITSRLALFPTAQGCLDSDSHNALNMSHLSNLAYWVEMVLSTVLRSGGWMFFRRYAYVRPIYCKCFPVCTSTRGFCRECNVLSNYYSALSNVFSVLFICPPTPRHLQLQSWTASVQHSL